MNAVAAPSLRGSIVAIVTPMLPDGSLDYETYRTLLDWHVAEGTAAIVAVGTTGESPTVSMDEHAEIIRVTVEHVAKRVPVIAGVGGNSTSEAIELARYARAAGADMGLQVVPYYNKPSQEGMYRHFRAVAEAVDLPSILYNVPGRTVADMNNDTVLRLAEVPGIVGIKDATGDIVRGMDLVRRRPPSFAVYSGDDPTAMALMLLGGDGNISVTANVVPRLMADMCAAALAGDVARARALNDRMFDLNRTLFLEANPMPVKWAMAEIGKTRLGYRLPMCEPDARHHEAIRAALRTAGAL